MAGTGGNRRADSNIASKSDRTVSQPHPKPQWTLAVSLLDSIAVKGEDRNGRERVREVCWHAEYSVRHGSPTCSSCDIYSLCGNDTKRSVDKKHVPQKTICGQKCNVDKCSTAHPDMHGGEWVIKTRVHVLKLHCQMHTSSALACIRILLTATDVRWGITQHADVCRYK